MPLEVARHILNDRYQENCYVVRSGTEATEAVVVDPGGDTTELVAGLQAGGVSVAAIFITHADIDHVEGVARLVESTGAEVWCPIGEVEALRHGVSRGGGTFEAHDVEHAVTGGDVIEVAGMTFEVLDVPGHSIGHIAFVADGVVFSGDLLFAGSVGRVDSPGGDWDTLIGSIKSLVARVGREAVLYSGHGEPTTLGHELDTNPFLGELRAV